MNKSELLKTLSEKTGQSQNVVNDVLNAFVETTVEAVRDNGEQVTLVGLGTFKQKLIPAHEGFNPLTKQKIQVDATRNVQFKVMSTLKVKE
nr:MAG TPA: DNA binding protein [Caudoviricetes sp.]